MPQPLWSLTAGESAVIDKFDSSLAENYQIRLMELGFHAGEEVTCMQSPALGAPRVYRVSNTIFSLDNDVAEHILVTTREPV